MIINAISLWEPWATAMRIKAKRNETRSWPAPLSILHKPLLICGALHWNSDSTDFLKSDYLQCILKSYMGLNRPVVKSDMLLGKAACIVKPYASHPTSGLSVNSIEKALGDYSPFRFAWQTLMLNNTFDPFPVKGKQGIFKVEIPDSSLAARNCYVPC